MKTMRVIITAIVLAFTSITSLRADEALDTFKKDMAILEASIKKQEAALKDNPMGNIAVFRSAIGGLKASKTDGLPADLKEGFAEFVAVMSKMGDIFIGWPEKPEEMQQYLLKKMVEDPESMEAIGAKLKAIVKEVEPAVVKLEALGKKYGIENMSALAPGK